MSTIYQPFTYLIGWSKNNIWYYGAKYGAGSNPNVLWNPYKTSSVKVADYINIFGEPDIIEVRRCFKTAEETLDWEHKLLKRINAKNNPNFLNKSNGGKEFGLTRGHEKPQSMVDKLRGTLTALNTKTGEFKRVTTEEFHLNDYLISPSKGRKQTQHTRDKLSKVRLGVKSGPQSKEWIKKRTQNRKPCPTQTETHKMKNSEANSGERNHFYGKSHSEKTRRAISERAKSRPKIVCEYCTTMSSMPNFKRWHGENCRHK